MGLLSGFLSLAQNVNKTQDGDKDMGESLLLPELKVDASEEELLDRAKRWRQRHDKVSGELKKRRDENENYWKGKQFPGGDLPVSDRPLVDNVLFTSLETFLPIATRQSPESVVEADNTVEGQAFADKLGKMLNWQADRLNLKMKLKKVARFWSLYLVGVLKHGWSEMDNDIVSTVIRPHKLILDPDATIDDDGQYTGEYVGEERSEVASKLLQRFPEKEKEISDKVSGKMGSEVGYVEWWTDEMVFFQLDEHCILGSFRNPHWNYDSEEPKIDEVTGQPTGETVTVPARNHFSTPRKPYTFLSVFNLGLHPWDDTSLFEQNLALQDKVNKRIRQIDKNIDGMNGGIVADKRAFTKEEAEEATVALRDGGIILVNDTNAIRRDAPNALPPDVYQSLMDYRNELLNVFGVRASQPESLNKDNTVRGKILSKSQDEGRIGGGVSEHLELFADNVFNWWAQLMVVYYTEPHYATVLGKEKAMEYVSLASTDFDRKALITVKDGSLIPKDPLTERNVAVDMASAGLIDPITMFEKMDFPNPRESAEKLYLWKTNPAALFPDMPMPVQMDPSQPQGQGLTPAPEPTPMDAAVGQSELSNVPLPDQGRM